MSSRFLAIDPGRDKCGLAVVDERGELLARAICPTPVLLEEVRALIAVHAPQAVLMGNGTHSRKLAPEVEALLAAAPGEEGASPRRLHLVDERCTTERARVEYWVLNPPRGLQRLIPEGMRVPPVHLDDLAALVMARDFVRSRGLD